MVITRIVPMSIARIAGACYAVLGLCIGGVFSLFAMAGSMFMPEGQQGSFGALFGVAAIVLAPIFYGLIGFVGAFVGALIFNWITKVVGGVEIQVQDSPRVAP